jgi:hypothetical protein
MRMMAELLDDEYHKAVGRKVAPQSLISSPPKKSAMDAMSFLEQACITEQWLFSCTNRRAGFCGGLKQAQKIKCGIPLDN